MRKTQLHLHLQQMGAKSQSRREMAACPLTQIRSRRISRMAKGMGQAQVMEAWVAWALMT